MADQRQDRIAMPSVAKDGSWDQVNPVIIGDVDDAVEAAAHQAEVQAVSDVDEAVRTNPDEDPKFTTTEDLEKKQKAAAAAARKAAEAKVRKAAE